MTISLEDKNFFVKNGAVVLRNFLSNKWIDLLLSGFEYNMKNPGPHACYYTGNQSVGLFRDDYCNWQHISDFKRVIFNSPLAKAAALLTGAKEIRLFHEHIFLKKAGTIKKTPWHQDLPYYCVDGDQGISFWIPLTKIDNSNKLEFIAGSHSWNKLYRPMKFSGIDSYDVPKDLYQDLPDIDNDPRTFQKLAWTMNISDVIAFDFRTVHGNTKSKLPNIQDRKAISIRFLGEKMRYSKRPGEKSPPFFGLNLRPGSPLDHKLFPIVWPR